MAGLSAKAKSRVYSSLEKYARSGMGMEKACDSLLRQPRVGSAEKKIYRGILKGLSQGRTIGDSLNLSGGVASPLEVEVVSASEEGGMLEKGFGHLAEYFRRLDQTRRRILKGLTYPIVLIHLAVPISTLAVTAFRQFSLGGVGPGPNFATAFWNMGKAMAVAYAIIFLLILGAVFLTKIARRSGAIDSLLNLIPLLGKARKSVAMERFSQVFEIFLLAGKKMSDALLGAGAASGSGLLREASAVGAEIVADGDPLASALYSAPGAFPNDFARGVAAAEESGQLDRELAEWSRYYSEAAKESMEQLAEWAPKLFYWAILFFVAFLIIRSALAYRDLLMNLLENSGF
jgi:type IV pilus assembly protein PilC